MSLILLGAGAVSRIAQQPDMAHGPLESLMRLAFAFSLVLLTGGVLQRALLPVHGVGRAVRAATMVAAGFVVLSLGATLLTLLPQGLTQPTWIALLALVTAAAVLINLARAPGPTSMYRPAQGDSHAIHARDLVFFGLATLTIVSAFVVDVRSQAAYAGNGFVQLWVVPRSAGDSDVVEVGVGNLEGHQETYLLRVLHEGQVIAEWGPVPLRHGTKWTDDVAVSARSQGVLDFRLFREGSPSVAVRSVTLRFGAPVLSQ